MFPSRFSAQYDTRMPMAMARVAKFHSTRRTRELSSSVPKAGKVLFSAAALIATGASGLWWFTVSGHDVPQLAELPATEGISRSSMSEREVTDILSQEAYSYTPHSRSGVWRYDGTRIAANTPCEDRFVHGRISSPSRDRRPWSAWGIFDGHSGWQTAELLSKQLVPFVRANLNQLTAPSDDQSAIKRAIVKGFVDLDNVIMNTALETARSKVPLQEKIRTLAPAYSGSCALLSLFNPSTRTLYVACTGDARAVLGQKSADGKWKAIPLSIDQNGDNADEAARLLKEHPGEDDLVKNGRVLGLMTSRAFGDA